MKDTHEPIYGSLDDLLAFSEGYLAQKSLLTFTYEAFSQDFVLR